MCPVHELFVNFSTIDVGMLNAAADHHQLKNHCQGRRSVSVPYGSGFCARFFLCRCSGEAILFVWLDNCITTTKAYLCLLLLQERKPALLFSIVCIFNDRTVKQIPIEITNSAFVQQLCKDLLRRFSVGFRSLYPGRC